MKFQTVPKKKNGWIRFLVILIQFYKEQHAEASRS